MADRAERDSQVPPDHDEEIPPAKRGYHPADNVAEPAHAPEPDPGISGARPYDEDSLSDTAHPVPEETAQ